MIDISKLYYPQMMLLGCTITVNDSGIGGVNGTKRNHYLRMYFGVKSGCSQSGIIEDE